MKTSTPPQWSHRCCHVTGAGTPQPRPELRPISSARGCEGTSRIARVKPQVREDPLVQKPVPSRSPFATSILGLNLSIEELQAQEAALEQEFSARFRRAVAATRESLSERLDTVFQGLKQIDENLLDELEEALIAADSDWRQHSICWNTVRSGIAERDKCYRALQQADQKELLKYEGIREPGVAPKHRSGKVLRRHDDCRSKGVGRKRPSAACPADQGRGKRLLICAADTSDRRLRINWRLGERRGFTVQQTRELIQPLCS